MKLISSLLAAALLSSNVIAHPGQSTVEMRAEMAERATFMQTSKRDLSHCAAKMKARGLEAKAIVRRAVFAKDTRKKRDITISSPYFKARDSATVANTKHLSSEPYTNATKKSITFSGNNSCILSPEVTQGPYYVSGEYVRYDVTKTQEGSQLLLDNQVIDMATCDPLINTMIEIWHCNSTGVYSGVVASGNGDTSDTENLDATFLRGLQPTDSDGVANSRPSFPATIPVVQHIFIGGYVSYVGQLFFGQDLITQVEATSPYSTNTQDLSENAVDTIFAEEAASSDPVVE